ncbi:MAG: Chromosome partition protein Smc [Mycoplasmataceae bacterium]|nr:MAG: Chromosome partition protein Smc [Mycoplasmataceae bacterium]
MTNTNIKNILLIGRTGNGKSTLANVIAGTDKFKESADSISETRKIEVAEFEENITQDGRERINYRVIDTVGIGDTRLTPRAVLGTIQEAREYLEQGLSQILFVTNGRFTEEERTAYKLLRSVIFDNEVSKYTTIIRTNFPEFEDERACERDRQALRNENRELLDIVNSAKIIYVDNPPVNSCNARRNNVNQETREVSREILLTLLGTFQGNYRPENLVRMNERINDYKTEKEKLEEELREKDKKMKEQDEKFQEKINNLNREQEEKFEKFRKECDKKTKEAQDKADEQIKEAQKQGNLNEKLLELIEKNRTEAEERARRDREASENKTRFEVKERESALRREMDLQKENDELKRKILEKKQKDAEDSWNKEREEFKSQIEQANNTINLVRDDMSKNYQKKPKGGCSN